MRILCGTDFSPLATEAATVAALWSRRCGGDMHLLHAVGAADADGAAARERLAREAERLRAFGATVGRADVVAGDADEVLAAEGSRRSADLIVVGAMGHRLSERWLLGSVAARTARDARVPVLVVRGAGPFERWLEGDRPLRIVVGFEQGGSAAAAVRWAAGLAPVSAIDLSVVHLVVPGEENRRLDAGGPGIGIELRPEAERLLREELRVAAAPLIGEVLARLTVQGALGRTDVHLVMAAQEAKAELLVVGSRQHKGFHRWWIGSVSSGVLHAAPMSVAVVPFQSSAS
jgi:nucleotide-binding universal stress UspA family protein